VANWKLVTNFWLLLGNTSSSNNFQAFIESTQGDLSASKVGMFRAESGFFDKTIAALLTTQGGKTLADWNGASTP
jgi:hypothetical protein